MIISNLMHCQALDTSSEVLVAGGYYRKPKSVIKNTVKQSVDAYAVALNFGKYGEAEAYNYTEQSVYISN